MVKQITVSVPDEVYREARVRAAERQTSVSALVGEFLRALAGGGSQFSQLEAKQREVQRQITGFRGSDRMSRDELHDRAIR